jgi:hypothetical protein
MFILFYFSPKKWFAAFPKKGSERKRAADPRKGGTKQQRGE